jgi:hypothetical protein
LKFKGKDYSSCLRSHPIPFHQIFGTWYSTWLWSLNQ